MELFARRQHPRLGPAGEELAAVERPSLLEAAARRRRVDLQGEHGALDQIREALAVDLPAIGGAQAIDAVGEDDRRTAAVRLAQAVAQVADRRVEVAAQLLGARPGPQRRLELAA